MHIRENDFGNFELISANGQVIGHAYSPRVLSEWLDRQYAHGLGIDLLTPDTRR